MKQRTFISLLLPVCLILAGCGKKDGQKQSPTTAAAPEEQTAKAVPPARHAESATPSDSPASKADEASLRKERQRIVDEIFQLTGKKTGGLNAEQWRIFKQRYWTASLDLPAPKTAQGGTAPFVGDLLAIPHGKEPLIGEILTGKFSSVTNKAEQKFLIVFHMLAMVTAGSGGTSLPAALVDRVHSAGVTRGDLFLFEVFNDAFVDVTQRGQLSPAEIEQWKQLARSPDGLYRLLALRTFGGVALQPEQRLDFYSLYVDEKDPGIMEEVVDSTFETGKPEAAVLLSHIRDRAKEAKASELVIKLDRSIEWLQKLPQRTK